MKLFNSYTNKMEKFVPIEEGKVSMYVCGPTVYNRPHIGNGRPIIVYDTLKKTFEALGYDVTYVSNFTDVDDKIIKKAKEEGITEAELTKKYIDGYNEDRRSLNADIPDITPKVTETMDEIIAFIADLVDKKAAYVVEGDVYFRVNAVEQYGALSKQKIDDLMVGARIDENSLKENPLDFTLWKKTDEGINWDSPWSKGRPGWHTECVVMINKEFKSHRIDIHGGGMDLKFPHHENEIAQSDCLEGHKVVHFWMHNEFLQIDSGKMSKSLNNTYTISDLEKNGFDAEDFRFFYFNAHYSKQQNFTYDSLKSARNARINFIKAINEHKNGENQLSESRLENYRQEFLDAINDDLNMPKAIAVCQKLLKEEKSKDIYNLMLDFNKILGLNLDFQIENDIIPQEIDDLATERWNAKQNRDFAKADSLRQILLDKGYKVLDAKDGYKIEKIK